MVQRAYRFEYSPQHSRVQEGALWRYLEVERQIVAADAAGDETGAERLRSIADLWWRELTPREVSIINDR